MEWEIGKICIDCGHKEVVMEFKRCPKCFKGHPKYCRLLPTDAKVCPNCGTKLEVVEIDMTKVEKDK